MTPSNVIVVKTSYDDFFESWLGFMQPIHRLTNKELQLATILLKRWFSLMEDLKVETIARSEFVTKKAKDEIAEMLKVKSNNLEVLLTKLRKSGFLVDGNMINMKFIPRFGKTGKLSLAILYDIKR